MTGGHLDKVRAETDFVEMIDVESDVGGYARALEQLHRQLRPSLPDDYARSIRDVLNDGARLVVLLEDGSPKACAVWRTYRTTFHGLRFYVDDLVVDADHRGRGYGKRLLEWLEAKARALECNAFDLESAVHRSAAHRFYFQAGLTIFAFGFTKPL